MKAGNANKNHLERIQLVVSINEISIKMSFYQDVTGEGTREGVEFERERDFESPAGHRLQVYNIH